MDLRVEPHTSTSAGRLKRSLENANELGSLRSDEVVTRQLLSRYLELKGVAVIGQGSTLHVHGCRLDEVTTQDPRNDQWEQVQVLEVQLLCDEPLPFRLHNGERLDFHGLETRQTAVLGLRVSVTYSFDRSGQRYDRRLVWRMPKDDAAIDGLKGVRRKHPDPVLGNDSSSALKTGDD